MQEMCKPAELAIAIGWILLLLIPPTVTDLREKKINVLYIFSIALGGAACNILWFDMPFTEILIGVGCGLLFLLVSYFTKEKIGYGDSFLIMALGLMCGGTLTLVSVVAALLLSGILGLILLFIRRIGRKTELAFAPALLITTVTLRLVAF